jgi:hypothetical protein
MMYLTERFQAHCQWCFRVVEADSAVDAIRAAEAHESCCEKREEKQAA